MGHRASVAFVSEGAVHAHYPHLGALDLRLAFGTQSIQKDRPLGGADSEPEFVKALKASLAGEDVEMVEGNTTDGDVDPDPYWEGESLSEWATEGVNYLHHEAAYVVDTTGDEWEVRAFDTVWYEAPGREPGDSEDPGTMVECFDGEEWGDYSGVTYADSWEGCATFAEFVNQLRDTLDEPERIPAFAPGGKEDETR